MSRYIDAEAFFKVINTLPYKDTSYPDASVYNGAISDVADMLTHFPPADVLEVRHGRYEQHDDPLYAKGGYWECSCCKWRISNLIFIEDVNYCPNCGAKMDEEDQPKRFWPEQLEKIMIEAIAKSVTHKDTEEDPDDKTL